MEKSFHTCAECEIDVKDCHLYNNFISKVFAFVFRSDRPACIRYIRENGEQAFAEEMTKRGEQTMRKWKKRFSFMVANMAQQNDMPNTCR